MAELPENTDHREFLDSLLSAIPSFVTHVDSDLVIRYINRIQPGLEMDEVLGADVLDFIVPTFRDVALDCFREVQATGEMGFYESKAVGPNGQISHYLNHVTSVRDSDARVGLCIVAQDVTKHRLREELSVRREQELRLLVEATGLGLWSWELSSDHVQWNDRMHEITGREQAADLQEWVQEIVHPEDRAEAEENGREALENGVFNSLVHRIRRPDGETRWVVSVGDITTDPSGSPLRLHGGLLDITERRSVEDQLRQSQKMEAVGSLTAGVAHNFNNMLAVIVPSLEMLGETVSEADRKIAKDALHAGQRATELVKDLMTFVGGSSPEAGLSLSIAGVLDQAVQISRRTFPAHIEVRTLGLVDGQIVGNAGELEQVFVNLLVNARDALVEARTEHPVVEVWSETILKSESDWIAISFRDNGPGIPLELLERVFDPFYTTKAPQGTGLGLATSRAIIEGHSGDLTCMSETGQGAIFRVCLPIEKQEVEESRPEEEADESTRTARILVIDDEPAVRTVTSRMIERSGWNSVAVADVRELEGLLAEDRAFQVVLLDRSLSDGSGDQLLPVLRRSLPSARILLYTGEWISENDLEVDGILRKPVRRAELARAIEGALEARR